MSDPQPPGAGNRRPPALESGGPRGWFVRLWRRLSLAALHPELDEIAAQRARRIAELDESTAARKGAEALAVRVSALGGAVERLARSREELDRHLETRIGQSLTELADLRNAFLTVRAEFEQARDRGLPELALRADGLAASAAALQREVEVLRDTRLPQAEDTLERHQATLVAHSREIEDVRDQRVLQTERTLERHQAALGELSAEVKGLRDGRLPQAEGGLAAFQAALEVLQLGLNEVRDLRMVKVEDTLAALQAEVDRVHSVLEGVQVLGEEVRDERLPALSARVDALIAKLHEDLTANAGLLDRLLRREPLHVKSQPSVEAPIPAAVVAASQRFIDSFRGSREEILGRVAEYLPSLRKAAPVLDLGCGRGGLLEVLRDAGIACRGVDTDPAMVAGCRERGLQADVGDALATLRAEAPGSLGAVTAIHVLEHLPAALWMSVVDAAAAALRHGGVLLVECPNPESLRVGGSLFWIDPTHHAPVHAEALAFVVRALGLEVEEVRFLHPFPPDQALFQPGQPGPLQTLAKHLDTWLSGPRDFLLLARKPVTG